MEYSKTSTYLFYSSLIGFVVTFFSFFTPIQFTTKIYDLEVSSSSKNLIQMCTDGTIKGGGFIFVMCILLLLFALVADIIVTIKISNGDDVPKWLCITFIPFGGVTIILAISLLVIFFSYFKGQMVGVSGSSTTATANDGGELWYMYLFFFEAGITAILAGIFGYKGAEPSYYHSSKRTVGGSYCRFREGDIVEFVTDNSYPPISKGTRCRVTSVLSSSIVYVNPVDDPLPSPASVLTSKLTLCGQQTQSNQNLVGLANSGSLSPSEINNRITSGNSSFVAPPSQSAYSGPRSASPSSGNSDANFEKIREYKKLLDEGVITQQEFERKKRELLNL